MADDDIVDINASDSEYVEDSPSAITLASTVATSARGAVDDGGASGALSPGQHVTVASQQQPHARPIRVTGPPPGFSPINRCPPDPYALPPSAQRLQVLAEAHSSVTSAGAPTTRAVAVTQVGQGAMTHPLPRPELRAPVAPVASAEDRSLPYLTSFVETSVLQSVQQLVAMRPKALVNRWTYVQRWTLFTLLALIRNATLLFEDFTKEDPPTGRCPRCTRRSLAAHDRCGQLNRMGLMCPMCGRVLSWRKPMEEHVAVCSGFSARQWKVTLMAFRLSVPLDPRRCTEPGCQWHGIIPAQHTYHSVIHMFLNFIRRAPSHIHQPPLFLWKFDRLTDSIVPPREQMEQLVLCHRYLSRHSQDAPPPLDFRLDQEKTFQFSHHGYDTDFMASIDSDNLPLNRRWRPYVYDGPRLVPSPRQSPGGTTTAPVANVSLPTAPQPTVAAIASCVIDRGSSRLEQPRPSPAANTAAPSTVISRSASSSATHTLTVRPSVTAVPVSGAASTTTMSALRNTRAMPVPTSSTTASPSTSGDASPVFEITDTRLDVESPLSSPFSSSAPGAAAMTPQSPTAAPASCRVRPRCIASQPRADMTPPRDPRLWPRLGVRGRSRPILSLPLAEPAAPPPTAVTSREPAVPQDTITLTQADAPADSTSTASETSTSSVSTLKASVVENRAATSRRRIPATPGSPRGLATGFTIPRRTATRRQQTRSLTTRRSIVTSRERDASPLRWDNTATLARARASVARACTRGQKRSSDVRRTPAKRRPNSDIGAASIRPRKGATPRTHRKGKRSDVDRAAQVVSRSTSEQWPRMPEDIARRQRAFTPDVLDDALASAGAHASETEDTRAQIETALQIARGLPPPDSGDNRSGTSSALAASSSTSIVTLSASVATSSALAVASAPVATAADGVVPRGAASYRGLAYDVRSLRPIARVDVVTPILEPGRYDVLPEDGVAADVLKAVYVPRNIPVPVGMEGFPQHKIITRVVLHPLRGSATVPVPVGTLEICGDIARHERFWLRQEGGVAAASSWWTYF